MTIRQWVIMAGVLLMGIPPVAAESTVTPFQSFVTHCIAMNTRFSRRADAATCQGMASRSRIVQGDAVRFLQKSSPDDRALFAGSMFVDRFNQVEQGQDMSKLVWFLIYEQSHPVDVGDNPVSRMARDVMNAGFGVTQINQVVALADAAVSVDGTTCLASVPWRDVTVPPVKQADKKKVKVVACLDADPVSVAGKSALECLPEPQAVVDSCVKVLAGHPAPASRTVAVHGQ